MKNILIIGASGTVGSATVKTLAKMENVKLTALSRHASKYFEANAQIKVLDGDATDKKTVMRSLDGQDAVFVTVSGEVRSIVDMVILGMKEVGLNRLVFISSMGIYDEIPENIPYDNLKNNPILIPYRQAADDIEDSGLDYTIIRPGWFTNGDVNYEITQKGESFGGLNASIASIADAAKRSLINDEFIGKSIGINIPDNK